MTDTTSLRALLAAATEGPWTPGNSTISWWIYAPSNKSRCWIAGHLGADTWHDKEARQRALVDRDLIVALRNNAEAMLDRISELEGDKERLESLCKANSTLARMNGDHRDRLRERATQLADALERLGAANDEVAERTTRERYLTDLADVQPALLALDDARSHARALLTKDTQHG